MWKGGGSACFFPSPPPPCPLPGSRVPRPRRRARSSPASTHTASSPLPPPPRVPSCLRHAVGVLGVQWLYSDSRIQAMSEEIQAAGGIITPADFKAGCVHHHGCKGGGTALANAACPPAHLHPAANAAHALPALGRGMKRTVGPGRGGARAKMHSNAPRPSCMCVTALYSTVQRCAWVGPQPSTKSFEPAVHLPSCPPAPPRPPPAPHTHTPWPLPAAGGHGDGGGPAAVHAAGAGALRARVPAPSLERGRAGNGARNPGGTGGGQPAAGWLTCIACNCTGRLHQVTR